MPVRYRSAAALLEQQIEGAPPEMSKSIRSVVESMRDDTKPSSDDLAKTLVWLLEGHRKSRLEIRDRDRRIVELGQELERKSAGGIVPSVRNDPKTPDQAPEPVDPYVSRVRQHLGLGPSGSVRVDEQGRRVLTTNPDKEGG